MALAEVSDRLGIIGAMETSTSDIVVVTAVGQDGPGVVAALARVVYDLGGNLDDATMTRLHGAFAAMVAARMPDGVGEDAVRAALSPVARDRGLTVMVQTVAEAPAEAAPDTLLTVYGADKPGIVAGVTEALAGRGVNITDMDTRVAGTPSSPVYVMLLEVVAGDTDFAADLETLRPSLGVDITVSILDTEAL